MTTINSLRWTVWTAVFALIVLGFGWAIASQEGELKQLKGEAERLKQKSTELGELREKWRLLSAAQVDTEEFKRLQDENGELQKLKAALGPAVEVKQELLAKLPEEKLLAPGMTPVSELGKAGTALPGDAMKSFFWNISQKDPSALAKQLVLDEPMRAKLEKLYASLDEDMRQAAGSPEYLVALYYQSLFSRVTGMQAYSQEYQDTGRAMMKLRVQTRMGKVHERTFETRQVDGAWKMLVPEAVIDATVRLLGAGELR